MATLMLALVALGSCGGDGPSTNDTPNVLLVTFDTLRADRLGAYGKSDAQTPHLDDLAQRGVVFERALSAAPITTPAHSTMFTGTFPPFHGVRDNGMFVLPESQLTLAEILRDEGYKTSAFVGSFPTTSKFGLAQGFDHFDEDITQDLQRFDGVQVEVNNNIFFDERNSSRVNDRFLAWLDQNHDAPFFTWLHYWDAHHPHTPPEPFATRFAHDLYQGEISHADASFGAVMAALERLEIDEKTVVFIISDHGEGLGQHDELTHSLLAYNATLHVPFIIAGPGIPPGKRVNETVGSVDLLPTLLSLLDIPTPEAVQGHDLMPVVDGAAWAEQGRTYYAETLSPRLTRDWGELRVLVEGDRKYIHGPRPELFDIELDFNEWNDLAPEQPEATRSMRARMEKFLASIASISSSDAIAQADEETMSRLAGLGYINSVSDELPEVTEVLSSAGAAPQDFIHLLELSSTMRQAFASGNYASAKAYAEKMLQDDPHSGYARGILAYSLAALGDVEAALGVVESSVADVASVSVPYKLSVLAQAFHRSELRERVVSALSAMVSAIPTADSHYLLGEMNHELGHQQDYRNHLQHALALDDAHARARLSLAILEADTGNIPAALQHFDKLLEDHPRNARYYYNYAVVLHLSGNDEKALSRLDEAESLDPQYAAPNRLRQQIRATGAGS